MSAREVILGDDVVGVLLEERNTDISLLAGQNPKFNKSIKEFDFLENVGLNLTAYDTPPGTRPASKRSSFKQSSSRRSSDGSSSQGSDENSPRRNGVDYRDVEGGDDKGYSRGGGYYNEDNMDSRPSTTASSSAESELEPERAASKAERLCKKGQSFVDPEREARKRLKAERERASKAREAVRKQRADKIKSEARVMKRRSDVPEDMRFSPANVVSYDIPGVRPYKCCGTFYVQPFSLIAPPKRVTRTEQVWRNAGLLPGQPGEQVFTKEAKESEQRKLDIDHLLKVPLRTHQYLPKQERWNTGPQSNGIYPSNITYPSGTCSFSAPTWDFPDEPAVTIDGRNLKKSTKFSQSGRILVSGELAPEPAPFVPCLPRKKFELDAKKNKQTKTTPQPTISCTSPAPHIDVKQYGVPTHADEPNEAIGKQWELCPYLPTSTDPPVGRRGDGTVTYEHPLKESIDNQDRHAQSKSEISEAIAKYRSKHQPSDVLILHARSGEVRKLSERNVPLHKVVGPTNSQVTHEIKMNDSVVESVHEGKSNEGSSDEFAKLFSTSAEDWSCLSPKKVMSEWSDMSDWEAGLLRPKSKITPTSSRGEPRVMSAIVNDELPLVRRGSQDGESAPTTASMWRSSRGQPLPPHTPPLDETAPDREGGFHEESRESDSRGGEMGSIDEGAMRCSSEETEPPKLVLKGDEDTKQDEGVDKEDSPGVQKIVVKLDTMSFMSDEVADQANSLSLSTNQPSPPSSPPRNSLGQLSQHLSRVSTSKSKNSRPSTEEYMHDVYRTHIEQSGLFPHFVAASEPPASPLRYSSTTKKVSGDRLLVDPAAESAMAGLLFCGAADTQRRLDKKSQGSASLSSQTGSSSTVGSKKRLHRPITITDNFKRELLKSGAHGNIMLKR